MEQEVDNILKAQAANPSNIGTYKMAHFTLTQLLEHEIGQFHVNKDQGQACDITKATDLKLENLLKANSNFCFKNVKFAASPQLNITDTKMEAIKDSEKKASNEVHVKREQLGSSGFKSMEADSQSDECEATLIFNFSTQKSSSDDLYKCEECLYETEQKLALEYHSNIHKPVSERAYRCGYCSSMSKTKSLLKSHVLNTHKLALKEFSYKSVKKPSEIVYRCKECPFQSKRKDTFRTHVSNHKSVEDVDTIKCDLCSYKVKEKRYLKLHMALHETPSDSTVYACDV